MAAVCRGPKWWPFRQAVEAIMMEGHIQQCCLSDFRLTALQRRAIPIVFFSRCMVLPWTEVHDFRCTRVFIFLSITFFALLGFLSSVCCLLCISLFGRILHVCLYCKQSSEFQKTKEWFCCNCYPEDALKSGRFSNIILKVGAWLTFTFGVSATFADFLLWFAFWCCFSKLDE